MKSRFTKYEDSYEKSNSEIRIVGAKSFPSKLKYAIVNSDVDNASYRQRVAQNLVDGVCKELGIQTVRVVVKDTSRPHSTNNFGSLKRQTLGQYRYALGVPNHPISITIWNLTAVRKQRVSNKMFLGTLEHELIHHYDTCKLKLSNSLHTTGFYKRIELLDKMFK